MSIDHTAALTILALLGACVGVWSAEIVVRWFLRRMK